MPEIRGSAAALEPLRARLRAWFPALTAEAGGPVFLENAGGSQVPRTVPDAVRDYMRQSYVQLGAGYPLSRAATAVVERAHAFSRVLVNAGDGQVALGPSTSVLLRLLGDAYADALPADREIVVAESGHEANVGPWKRAAAAAGAALVWWRFDRERMTCPLDNLEKVLSSRTAIVALPHVSNLLGGVEDLRRVTELAHAAGARVVADGVAYAPHRAIDVAAWGVDWYAFSCYKVYGPHLAVLYGRDEAFAELTGPNHFFVPAAEIPYKFELGGVDHEACAGWLGVAPYLEAVAGMPAAPAVAAAGPGSPVERATVEAAGSRLAELEAPLVERLLGWLRERPGVRIAGLETAGPGRVGTISFTHDRLASREIAAAVDRSGIAIRHGHMYAWHLCQALGLDPEDGVVRVSLLHYNTPQEIERLLEVLDRVV